MARDEKNYHVRVFVDPPGPAPHEKIFVNELASFLQISRLAVKKHARQHGILYRTTRRQRPAVYWVTPNGAQRIMVHVRLIQQEWTDNNRNRCWFLRKLRERKEREKNRAKALKILAGG